MSHYVNIPHVLVCITLLWVIEKNALFFYLFHINPSYATVCTCTGVRPSHAEAIMSEAAESDTLIPEQVSMVSPVVGGQGWTGRAAPRSALIVEVKRSHFLVPALQPIQGLSPQQHYHTAR